MEGDRVQREDCFAGFIHWLDIILESSGRYHCAKLASCTDDHRNAGGCSRPEDTGDPSTCYKPRVTDAEGAVFGASRASGCTDINVIVAIDTGG